jgi:hypothetical protein
MSLSRRRLKLGFWVAIVLLCLVSPSLLQAQPSKIALTPLAADQKLWKTYSALPVPAGQQIVMAVRLIPKVPKKYCWVDVLVTKTVEGGEMFQRHSCDQPPTGDFRKIGGQQRKQMQQLQRSLQSVQYLRYDGTRFGSAHQLLEPRHDVTYMSQGATIQVEYNSEFPKEQLPTAIRSVLEQFWMMLSENVS